MSACESLEDIAAARMAGLLAEERMEDVNTCCARCKRGTRAHGNFPCAYDQNCECHRKGATR